MQLKYVLCALDGVSGFPKDLLFGNSLYYTNVLFKHMQICKMMDKLNCDTFSPIEIIKLTNFDVVSPKNFLVSSKALILFDKTVI